MNRRLTVWTCLFYFSKKDIFILSLLVRILHKAVSIMCSIDLHYSTRIGKGLMIHHGFGLVVHRNAVIGNNVVLRNGVVIGVKDVGLSKAPVVGDGVVIGAHAVLLGDIHIGNHATIGAGSVVLSNVGEGEVWAGNPAKRVK